ncbi:GNAT family N-acetyltransferase [Paraclostridium bifermentans]|uniref:GNAT family N-acetyltransferase n=1 Tax=Paraclostridium bifermentans TaxID=1490 RepID=UPI000A16CD20|nr:GNAT family N-acetyltransferase [Paraclostridium bifermentans]OSB08489.1 GNAT family N-acetyltransferase [Paraclostridium bifermentans]
MNVRNFKNEDIESVLKLFYDTVHNINSKDYAKEQLKAWAPKELDKLKWIESLNKNYSLVVEEDTQIIGFGDIDSTGYLDRLYVHKNHQGKKVASNLITELENYVFNKGVKSIITDASITAKPFFENKGYKVIKEQQVELRGQVFTNFKMIKNI